MPDDSVEHVHLRIPASVLAKVERVSADLRATNPLTEHVTRNVLLVFLINAGAEALLSGGAT